MIGLGINKEKYQRKILCFGEIQLLGRVYTPCGLTFPTTLFICLFLAFDSVVDILLN